VSRAARKFLARLRTQHAAWYTLWPWLSGRG